MVMDLGVRRPRPQTTKAWMVRTLLCCAFPCETAKSTTESDRNQMAKTDGRSEHALPFSLLTATDLRSDRVNSKTRWSEWCRRVPSPLSRRSASFKLRLDTNLMLSCLKTARRRCVRSSVPSVLQVSSLARAWACIEDRVGRYQLYFPSAEKGSHYKHDKDTLICSGSSKH